MQNKLYQLSKYFFKIKYNKLIDVAKFYHLVA